MIQKIAKGIERIEEALRVRFLEKHVDANIRENFNRGYARIEISPKLSPRLAVELIRRYEDVWYNGGKR